MKSRISVAKKVRLVGFPLLATHKQGFTVLFSQHCVGMVVANSDSMPYPIGHYSTHWRDIKDESLWDILPETSTVTLIQTCDI